MTKREPDQPKYRNNWTVRCKTDRKFVGCEVWEDDTIPQNTVVLVDEIECEDGWPTEENVRRWITECQGKLGVIKNVGCKNQREIGVGDK